MPRKFSPPPRVSDPDMHHVTCVTHVPWCMPGSLTSGFLWSRWRGKYSRHSWRMRNPQFCVSGKRPMPWHHSCRITRRKLSQQSLYYNFKDIKNKFRYFHRIWITVFSESSRRCSMRYILSENTTCYYYYYHRYYYFYYYTTATNKNTILILLILKPLLLLHLMMIITIIKYIFCMTFARMRLIQQCFQRLSILHCLYIRFMMKHFF